MCAIEACDRSVYCRGWCKRHYSRWHRTGSPTRPPRSQRRVRKDGYVFIYRPGHPLAYESGWVREHRLVVFEAGIPVPPGTNVHHINGIKSDNRLENLEVLSVAEHARLHKVKEPVPCEFCGALFKAARSGKRGQQRFCSKRCSLRGVPRGIGLKNPCLESGFVTNQYGTWPLRSGAA